MESLTLQSWLTLAIIGGMFASLMFTRIKAEVAFLAAMSLLFVCGILDVKGAFGGFSSESVLVVGVLYIVIAGLTFTGVLNQIVKHFMGHPKTLCGAIVRLMLPVALLSSLLSNTTVVALFINVVRIWAKRLHISPSKLLIPLSYASGMGGICTLIGTPPNMIISGMYADYTGTHLSIFTPTLVGLFCLGVGVLSVIALQKLLPERQSPMEQSKADDFTAELRVPSDNPYIGMTIDEALRESGMSSMGDSHLIAIRRFDDEIVSPVEPDEFIMGGDRLVVSGEAKSILRLSRLFRLSAPMLEGILENEESDDVSPLKSVCSTLIVISMVLLSAFGVVSLLTSCILAAFAMVICRCCSSDQAMKAINWNIIIVFAGSVAIGKAIEQTGIAQLIASELLDLCGSNPYVVLTFLCLTATFITEFISNTAAGAIFCPIAITAANALNVNPLTFCIALMISTSSSFATPIGSPTHMLVYTPGGYRFSDFMRIGIIMNLIILAANIFITTLLFPL